LQPQKKMVPEPLLPTRGGSSPKWGAQRGHVQCPGRNVFHEYVSNLPHRKTT
jgi:hypothetical protein